MTRLPVAAGGGVEGVAVQAGEEPSQSADAGRGVPGNPAWARRCGSYPAMMWVIFARDVAPPSTASRDSASSGPSR